MEIGIGLLTGQCRPDDERQMSAIYDELVDIARAADRTGLDSVWVSEHHFSDDGYLSGTAPALAAIAEATEQVELGSYIALAPLHDAVRFAEDMATVDLLADGRLTVGTAVGYRDEEFENFGVPKSERVDRLVDAVRTFRGAWSDGPLKYDPEFHPAGPGVTVTPKPEQPPNLLLGGMAKPAVQRAARLGDGWAADATSLSIEGMKKRLADIQQVREEHGLDDNFDIYVAKSGFVADSEEEAWETIKDGAFHMRRKYDDWFDKSPSIDESAERRQEVRENAVLGSPSQVADELARYGDALDEDIHLVFKTYYPGIGTDTMIECVERVANEVAPSVR